MIIDILLMTIVFVSGIITGQMIAMRDVNEAFEIMNDLIKIVDEMHNRIKSNKP